MGTETELDVDLEEESDIDETPSKEAEPEKPDKDAWDKDRQALDFERANVRRAHEQIETLNQAYEQATSKITELESMLQSLKTEKQSEQDKLDDMDPDIVDEKVANNIRRLEKLIIEQRSQLGETRQEIAYYKQRIAEEEAQKRNEQAKESVLSTVEDVLAENGVQGAAKYRNEASKLADELVDTGKEKQPKTVQDAIKLMTKCYLQVKASKDKSKKGSVSVDTGKAGPTTPARKSTGIKPGRLADVKAQMLQNPSWRE